MQVRGVFTSVGVLAGTAPAAAAHGRRRTQGTAPSLGALPTHAKGPVQQAANVQCAPGASIHAFNPAEIPSFTHREFRDAARIMGNVDLFKQMEAASECIKRDVIFAASLYVT